ncbi:MAG: peptidylprolyl isomerase [Microcoleaceae cyanobacterium]
MKSNWISRWIVALGLTATLVLSGCSSNSVSENSAVTNSSDAAVPEQTETVAAAPSETGAIEGLPQLEGKATVVMQVNGSPITIEVDGTAAPVTAGNFVDLVNKGVYDDLVFHRVVREPQPFVVQGGDPQGKDPGFPAAQLGTGGYTDPATSQERYVPLEIKPEGAKEPVYSSTLQQARVTKPPELKHTRGAVAMARSQAPDSASAQFYFTLADLPFLDGNYAVFGYVTDGMDVVDKIQQGDRIESAEVTEGLENLKS